MEFSLSPDLVFTRVLRPRTCIALHCERNYQRGPGADLYHVPFVPFAT